MDKSTNTNKECWNSNTNTECCQSAVENARLGRFGLAGAVKRDERAGGAIKQIHCLYYTHVPQITSELEHERDQDEDEQMTLMIIWFLVDMERKGFPCFFGAFWAVGGEALTFVRQAGQRTHDRDCAKEFLAVATTCGLSEI